MLDHGVCGMAINCVCDFLLKSSNWHSLNCANGIMIKFRRRYKTAVKLRWFGPLYLYYLTCTAFITLRQER